MSASGGAPKISSFPSLDRASPTPALKRSAAALAVALEHPAALYVASLSPGSRRSTVDGIKRAARFFGTPAGVLEWHRIGFAHVTALRSHLAEKHAPATCNRVLSALRGVLKFAVRLGLMERAAMLNAIDVPTVRGSREPTGRSLSRDELGAMFSAARDGDAGARDRCLLALLCGAGLRRAELSGLNVADVEQGGDSIRVRGKGNKERIVPLPPPAARLLRAWLEVRGPTAGPLLYSLAYHELTRNRITAPGIYCVLQLLADRAGVAHFSPHDLRRTYVGDLLDSGADIATVQRLAGHADPSTTSRYDRRGLRARREAVDRLDLPC
jgi:site-specific recombinase XerD